MQLHILSIILGILITSAVFFYFYFRNNKDNPILNSIRNRFSSVDSNLHKQITNTINVYYRENILKTHLLSNICPFSSLLIPPKVIVPPIFEYGLSEQNLVFPTQTLFPDIPDYPQAISQYPVQTTTVDSFLSIHNKLCIIGEPGSGKSTLLADFVFRNIANESEDFFLYLHACDVLSYTKDKESMLEMLSGCFISQFTNMQPSLILKYLEEKLDSQKAFLVLDGMDELTTSEQITIVSFLNLFFKHFPYVKTLVTGSTYFLDGLLDLGFKPVSIAYWNDSTISQYINKLAVALNLNNEQNIVSRKTLHLVKHWTKPYLRFRTPFELTTILSNIFLKLSKNTEILSSIRLFFDHLLDPEQRHLISIVAYNLYEQNSTHLKMEKIEEHINTSHSYDIGLGESSIDKDTIIEILHKNARLGLIKETLSGAFIFLSPVVFGYLASMSSFDMITKYDHDQNYPSRDEYQAFRSANIDSLPFIDEITISEQKPLFKDVLIFGRWLKYAKPSQRWFVTLITTIQKCLQSDDITSPVLLKLITLLLISLKPGELFPILNKIKEKQSIKIFTTLAFAYGLIDTKKSLVNLAELIKSKSSSVQNIACAALGMHKNKSVVKILDDIIKKGHENLKCIAAESLVNHGKQGTDIIKNHSASSDLLIRRASIIGLSKIKAPWAFEIIKNASYNEQQWVVRNFASNTITALENPTHMIENPLPDLGTSTWAQEYRNKSGSKLSAQSTDIELLLDALENGNTLDQYKSLSYIMQYQTEEAFIYIYEFIYNENLKLSNYAYHVLWYLSLKNNNLPSPEKFGYY